jgi:hypothetical protein
MTERTATGALLAAMVAVACCAGLPAVAAVGAWLIAPLAGLVALAFVAGWAIVHHRRCRRDHTPEARS